MEVREFDDLPGVRTYDLRILPDERGFFVEAFRRDWKELGGEDEMVQANISVSYPGIIRAWHWHLRGQVDYSLVLRGALKICTCDDRDESPTTKGKLVEIIASSQKPQVVRIPSIYWHGSRNVSDESSLLIYFGTRLYDYKNPAEERRPCNDPKIIDPKTGEPFDWNTPPHK